MQASVCNSTPFQTTMSYSYLPVACTVANVIGQRILNIPINP